MLVLVFSACTISRISPPMKKNKPFFDKDALLSAFGGISAGAILCLALAPHYIAQIQDSAFLAGVQAAQTITPLPSPAEKQPSLPRREVASQTRPEGVGKSALRRGLFRKNGGSVCGRAAAES
jgi:hypothetical protein